MEPHREIIRLFKSLSESEREKVLDELKISSIAETVEIECAEIVCCPHCSSKLFVKNGKRKGAQKYKCKACCKVFTSRTGTSLHRLQKPEKFELYKSMMMESYYPIKQIAKKVGISIQTAFDWRHKILSGATNEIPEFEGLTEMDDIWFLYSQKGRKGLKYSRNRGGSKRAGDNGFQAKLLITADRSAASDMSLVRIGRLRKADIERKVSGRFAKGCKLVSDKHRSIASFAKSEKVEHVRFKASKHTAGGEYHVQNINNMASGLKSVINDSLRGVSTKYLQNYANWFELRRKKISTEKIGQMLLGNKNSATIHTNREGIYKWFIENFSERTYRCPVKREFCSALDDDALAKLNL